MFTRVTSNLSIDWRTKLHYFEFFVSLCEWSDLIVSMKPTSDGLKHAQNTKEESLKQGQIYNL